MTPQVVAPSFSLLLSFMPPMCTPNHNYVSGNHQQASPSLEVSGGFGTMLFTVSVRSAEDHTFTTVSTTTFSPLQWFHQWRPSHLTVDLTMPILDP